MRAALLCGLTAIFVARPLLASETPTTIAGDGLPFAMLTLLLAAVWLFTELAEPRGVRFGLAEAAWLALLAWFGVSTFAATRSGYARAAINGFWEWTALGMGYLLLRQLLRTAEQKRALMAVMVGVALVLSLDGLYQFFVELPLARALYRADPDKMLLESNVDAPPGSMARALFEQRLASTEPSAAFSLANSLAGFLTPWLLTAIAVGWLGEKERAESSVRWRRLACAAVCALPMAACLVLTKSRAGYLASLAGFALLVLGSLRRWRHAGLLVAGTATTVAALFAAGVAVGALDRQVLSEAFKSLSYRAHYWHGALGMVAQHPWVGCGPGNFQDAYTRFKLPEASEVVADPHNFAFEIWATAGTPGVLAFALVLAGIAIAWWRAGRFGDTANNAGSPMAADGSWMALAAAGVAGFLLALLMGMLATIELAWPVLVAGCVVTPAVCFCLAHWIRSGSLPAYVPFCAATALIINLLVAGGISFAGVAGSLWLLAAVGTEDAGRKPRFLPRGALLTLCALNAGLFITCYLTAYRPVLACRRATAQAMRHPERARQYLLAAAAADPWADAPWRMLAEGDFAIWQRDPERRGDVWEREQQEVLRLRPHSSAAWQEAGERYFAAAEKSRGASRDTFLSAAIEHFGRAAELYPNSALVHARLALALSAAGRADAPEQAALAIKLHELTPHLDQKLPRDILGAVQALTGKN